MTRINLLRHNCKKNGFARMLQTFIMKGKNELKDQCPFYWVLPGGNSYNGNIHYFTFWGIRITIDTTKKKDLWTV